MKKLFTFLALLSLLSCGDKSSKSEELFKEVILVHDSIMPWMDEMHELSESLGQISALDSLRAEEFNAEKLKLNLDDASEAMMLWMSEFKPEQYKANEDSLNEYLLKEKQKISNVGLKMKSSMIEAKKFLNEE